MSYLDDVAMRIRDRAMELGADVPEDSVELFRVYAVLALASGAGVTNADVHNAWSAWMLARDPRHIALVPYSELPLDVEAQDSPFTHAIREVSEDLGSLRGADTPPPNLASWAVHISAMASETDRHLQEQSSRSAGGLTRASVLVGAAGVVATTQFGSNSFPLLTVGVGVAAVLALGAGLVAVWPRKGTSNDLNQLLEEVWPLPEAAVEYRIMQRKHEVAASDETLLERRGKWTQRGFLLLGVAAAMAVVRILLPS